MQLQMSCPTHGVVLYAPTHASLSLGAMLGGRYAHSPLKIHSEASSFNRSISACAAFPAFDSSFALAPTPSTGMEVGNLPAGLDRENLETGSLNGTTGANGLHQSLLDAKRDCSILYINLLVTA